MNLGTSHWSQLASGLSMPDGAGVWSLKEQVVLQTNEALLQFGDAATAGAPLVVSQTSLLLPHAAYVYHRGKGQLYTFSGIREFSSQPIIETRGYTLPYECP